MGDLEELIFKKNIPGRYSGWEEDDDDRRRDEENEENEESEEADRYVTVGILF
jgi:hypothetical protein